MRWIGIVYCQNNYNTDKDQSGVKENNIHYINHDLFLLTWFMNKSKFSENYNEYHLPFCICGPNLENNVTLYASKRFPNMKCLPCIEYPISYW